MGSERFILDLILSSLISYSKLPGCGKVVYSDIKGSEFGAEVSPKMLFERLHIIHLIAVSS